MSPADISLDDIQKLQFTELERAQTLAQTWLNNTFDLGVQSVALRPSAVSLNSFNGIATLDNGERIFFKSHTEPGSIVKEYYNSEIMEQAGYNMLLPILREGSFGAQIALYPVVETPNLFDVTRALEVDGGDALPVLEAESLECATLLDIYKRTAQRTSAEGNVATPIYQLFWHRITGGRLQDFYGKSERFAKMRNCRWIINGVEQERTLQELIDEAAIVLDPNRAELTSVGHGDAHFGNVFLDEGKYEYFDPAFAGRHSPLLDVVKPLVHNTILQPYYYFPDTLIDVKMSTDADGTIEVDYPTYASKLRGDIWRIKQDELITPLLNWLEQEGALPYGRRPLDLASMCCPLLTMNLFDDSRYSEPLAFLGLAQAMQLGNGGEQDYRFAS